MLDYSSTNEDAFCEVAALKLTGSDVVLSITASGDRTLSLLAEAPPAKVVSIDSNGAQTQLFQLKLAALSGIPTYQMYRAYMAEGNLEVRAAIHKAHVERAIPATEKKSINTGVLGPAMRRTPMYCGALEGFARVSSFLARLFFGKSWITLIMDETDPARRKALLAGWPGDSSAYFGRLVVGVTKHLPRSWQPFPGLGFAAPGSCPVDTFARRFASGLATRRGRESPLASLLLTGRLTEECLPAHMTERGYGAVKGAVLSHTEIDVRTGDVVAFLRESDDMFNAFSFSDILSYMDQGRCDELFRLVAVRAVPGARFLFRQFLTQWTIPEDVRARYIRDEALEESLRERDSCFIYTFLAGVIAPTPSQMPSDAGDGGGTTFSCATSSSIPVSGASGASS
jgi:S-adenosylmethionine-diacylglycerol 3-amino-3-carboxypropyl transferase